MLHSRVLRGCRDACVPLAALFNTAPPFNLANLKMSTAPAATSAPAIGGSAGHAADWEGMWTAGGKVLEPGTRFDLGGPHKYLVKVRTLNPAGRFRFELPQAPRMPPPHPGLTFCLSPSNNIEIDFFSMQLVADGVFPKGRVFVPGCGRGYDVAALAAPDRFAVGLDLAPTAAATARAHIASHYADRAAYTRIDQGDFFSYAPPDGSFDAAWDHTMLCALPPARRNEWATAMAALLKPGATLVTLMFPIGPYGATHPAGQQVDWNRGPPFMLSSEIYHKLLEPVGFECVDEHPVPPAYSDANRVGSEAVSVWRKRH